jgi:hypothetical protein
MKLFLKVIRWIIIIITFANILVLVLNSIAGAEGPDGQTLTAGLVSLPIFLITLYFELNKDKDIKTKKSKGNKKADLSITEIIIIISFLIVGGGILIYRNGNKQINNVTDSVSNTKEYVSVEHGFKIDFPGMPEVDRQNVSSGSIQIPVTIYTVESADKNSVWITGVNDFTGIDINETSALENGINAAVQNTPGSKLIDSKFSNFLGFKSIDAHYTVPSNGTTYDGYIKYFIKGSKAYSILTIGVTESDFNKFADSFYFTQ